MSQKSRCRGFSLVELVIVVVIIGIIAAIAVPRISRGAKGAGDASLRGSLAGLRNAIDMYAAEHGGKFPGDCATCTGLETEIVDHLTKKTDANGAVGTTAGVHIYGPYLRSGFPTLPVCANKGASSLDINGALIGATTDGWFYSTTTGDLKANCGAAENDELGTAYNAY